MRSEVKLVMGLLALLIVLTIAAGIVIAKAEALPAQEAPALTGDLQLSGAPGELTVVACLRVDVVSMSADGAWADLTLPYVPPSIAGVMLFDGWHMIHGVWEQTGESILHLRFWPDDLQRLDGTVGIYLVILAAKD
jgi:hypothetical protein